MKKFITSIAFVLSFAGYVVYQQSTSAHSATVATVTSSAPDTSVPGTSAGSGAAVPPPTTSPASSKGQYRDGTYTGNSANAYYGNVQVKVTIQGGKITDVAFLDYPKDRSTSLMISNQAMPQLVQEAIQAQSANVNGVSGATDTSAAFQQSLSSALSQAA
jgi:uncharacterized protein with FMN-binding domain